MRVPLAKARGLAQFREAVREVIRVDRPPKRASEDQAVIPPQRPGRDPGLGLVDMMLAEADDELGRERERPPGLGRLEFRDYQLRAPRGCSVAFLDPLNTVCDLDRSSLPVEHLPVQAEHLAPPQAIRECQ